MTQERHPITPPAELVDLWREEAARWHFTSTVADDHIAVQAARWGADMELEACCEWLVHNYNYPEAASPLRAARRPKPPSLKELALQALYRFDDTEGHKGLTQEQIAEDFVIIRRALESLPS